MCERAHSHGVFCELVADVWRTEAVSNACELSLTAVPVAAFNLVYPFWNCVVGKTCVFPLPGFVVEVGVRFVMSVLAVLPYGILEKAACFSSKYFD